jgi:hypothetical protein
MLGPRHGLSPGCADRFAFSFRFAPPLGKEVVGVFQWQNSGLKIRVSVVQFRPWELLFFNRLDGQNGLRAILFCALGGSTKSNHFLAFPTAPKLS